MDMLARSTMEEGPLKRTCIILQTRNADVAAKDSTERIRSMLTPALGGVSVPNTTYDLVPDVGENAKKIQYISQAWETLELAFRSPCPSNPQQRQQVPYRRLCIRPLAAISLQYMRWI